MVVLSSASAHHSWPSRHCGKPFPIQTKGFVHPCRQYTNVWMKYGMTDKPSREDLGYTHTQSTSRIYGYSLS